jgi:hypothetical protein
MNTAKKLLILERSGSTLEFTQDNSGAYVLEGVFGEIDKLNRNNRIYTESEYLPQIEALQSKIKSSKLLGELDHPQNFDISLKNVSHIIEELRYDKANKQIIGKIRLLDTDAGKQAKALVDAGVPLHISSRAAGTVESDGKVKIKQLFTYDLVADPGFANAELKRVNEAYGFEDDADLLIYEIDNTTNTQTQIKEAEKMENPRFVSNEDFNNYSKYLAEEIKALKESINKMNDSESINAKVEKLEEYSSYLAEKMNQAIAYTEHVAEKADQSIQFADTLAEKLDQSIQYAEHVAEGAEQLKNYANYLAESYNEGAITHENVKKYMDYLKENIEKVTEYAEYVAETVNTNLLMEADTDAGVEAKDLEDTTKDVSGKIEFDGKEVDQTAHDDSKELEKELEGEDEAGKEVVEGAAEVKAEEAEAEKTEEDEAGKEVVESIDRMDAYKSEISSKLSALLEKAAAKKVAEPHFFKFISESKKEEFNALSTEEKTLINEAVSGKGFLTESQIYALWTNTLAGAQNVSGNEPYVLSAMPKEYKETWNKLSESKKNQLLAQSKYHRLETEYQVRNFWQTRDFREVAPVMEKVEIINEKNETVEKTLPYDMTGIAESLNKKFKK